MTAFRRTTYNFALEHAVHHARRLNRPVVVLEALRTDYPWASERLSGFVLRGMHDNLSMLRNERVTYYPYVERTAGEGAGLLESLATCAALIVTDDYPGFFLPAMVKAAGDRLESRIEAVDSNGIIPLREADRAFPTAHGFRRFVHQTLLEDGIDWPAPAPLADAGLPPPVAVPRRITDRWPPLDEASLSDVPSLVSSLPLDRTVRDGWAPGGSRAGDQRLAWFVDTALATYGERRNQTADDATSGLSAYLHFGHVSPHAVVERVVADCDWTPNHIERGARGSRNGWGLDDNRTGFLDQLITWREVGFNMAQHRPDDYQTYESLPEWALRTLGDHAADPREFTYTLERFAAADTHDTLWNAAQRQLVREGRMHNYLRMLWGKKILEWSASPRDALGVMIELNNRFALDGRDPTSYAGIFWVLGRYDRAWGPERPIFGKVRYMSSANTRRKLSVTDFVARYGP